MEIFLDTANIDEINDILPWGVIKGVTTNQKIFLKEKGVNFEEQSKKILKLVYPQPVSLEGPNNLDELIETATEYNTWGKNVVIKVPMLPDGSGLKAVKILEEKGIKTNVTAMMTVNQAFLAITAGASYASLFFNRIRDSGDDAVDVIKQSRKIIDEGGYKTKLIVGSIRSPNDVIEIASAYPHIITIPYKIMEQMPYHETTVKTLKEFDQAWDEFKAAEKQVIAA